jgi:CRISPR-associated endonuclease Csn1
LVVTGYSFWPPRRLQSISGYTIRAPLLNRHRNYFHKVLQRPIESAEFWRLPPKQGKPGKVELRVIPMLHAAMDAEARRLQRPVTDRRPHPAAKLLMRLHKDDVVAFGDGAARRLLRVVKFSGGQIVLADLQEGGALKARDADRSDPFKYVNGSISKFTAEKARKVYVDPSGRVLDQGPLPW